jgi:ADP-heptose:LPS heptosyltransferase
LNTLLTKDKTKKVLIIRFSSIGDIVLTAPVIRYAKEQLKYEVHFLTKKSFESILVFNPHLDKIYTINKKVSEVLPQLKLEEYDAIIDLHKNLRTMQVRWALRVPYFSFDKLNWEKWLMVNFKINRLPKIHIVERYGKPLNPLAPKGEGDIGRLEFISSKKDGGDDDTIGLLDPEMKFFHLENKFPDLAKLLSLNRQGEEKHDNQAGLSSSEIEPSKIKKQNAPLAKSNSPSGARGFSVFAIGGAHATKRLPLSKIISICSKIKSPIILLGGKEDATIGEEIVQNIREDRVINMCGKTTLQESMQLIKNARKVITHDTGMMHIAASFKKEIISIWGNTIPEFGMTPFYADGIDRNTIVQVENLSCRPCSKIGFEECPKGHFKCMMDIDEDKIVDLADSQ